MSLTYEKHQVNVQNLAEKLFVALKLPLVEHRLQQLTLP
jgi:hypothetical protein